MNEFMNRAFNLYILGFRSGLSEASTTAHDDADGNRTTTECVKAGQHAGRRSGLSVCLPVCVVGVCLPSCVYLVVVVVVYSIL